ncbi:MAG: tripartite tricarboxylate transporter substrate-binding protein, partial [Proteobacteria bacterium]|nr:tripartite tricarboxylate transporter substrate-binding protein [Pseudomonadota bacterium]
MNNSLKSLALCALLAFSAAVSAQAYPNKTVRIVVPYPPGGTVDVVARVVAQRLTEQMGQQFIIENRGGANTAIASELFAKTAAPDGYT